MKIILLYFFIAVSYCCFSQKKLDSIFKNAKITGVQLISINNCKVQTYFYGTQQAGETAAITEKTVFQAASLSKPVLAYIALRLVDKKILSLDTPLYHYYKYERIKADSIAKKITARMVLHHLSGLPNWAVNPLSKEWSSSILQTKHIPVSGWSYSGEGFMFLQLCIENLLQQSLETIAVKEVFVPLNMTSSSFIWQPSFENYGAYGHDKVGEITGRTEFFLPGGAFSLLTTAADYNSFVQALMTGNGLAKQTHQLMLNDLVSVKKNNIALSTAASRIFWGLGVGIQENDLGKAIWHWGDNGDFKCFFMAFPHRKSSIVYFTNSENGINAIPAVLDYLFGKHPWWGIQWLDKDF